MTHMAPVTRNAKPRPPVVGLEVVWRPAQIFRIRGVSQSSIFINEEPVGGLSRDSLPKSTKNWSKSLV